MFSQTANELTCADAGITIISIKKSIPITQSICFPFIYFTPNRNQFGIIKNLLRCHTQMFKNIFVKNDGCDSVEETADAGSHRNSKDEIKVNHG